VIGRRIGPYELQELLGEGGMGEVYAAWDHDLGRPVAVKTLWPQYSRNPAFVQRFNAEAQSLGRLSHSNITTLYTVIAEANERFIVMELVGGFTLEALIARVHRLSLRESLAVVAQIAAGLTYAHRMGVIHRDIKPANLKITDAGALKIMDFGIARVRGSHRLTRASEVVGSVLYAAPEQIRGEECDERSDIYSLGIVLYEMLSGNPPFVFATEHELMTAHLERAPLPLSSRLPNLDARVGAAVLRALAKNPVDRFASVDEFAGAAGASALRGEAADILEACLKTAFRNAAPAATKFLDRKNIAGARPSAAGIDRVASWAAPGGRVSTYVGERASRSAMVVPLALLGTVILALAGGVGYAVLQTETEQVAPAAPTGPSPKQPAPKQPPPEKAPAPAPPPPIAPSPKPGPLPPAVPPSDKQQPGPTAPPFMPSPSEQPSGVPGPGPQPAPKAEPAPPPLPPPPPAEPTPAPSPAPPPRAEPTPAPPGRTEPPGLDPALLPEGVPDIRGRASGVRRSNEIKVDDQWVTLHGIEAAARGQLQERQHESLLGSRLRGHRLVACYKRPAGTHRCYVDGQDIAGVALREGIARPASNAPPEYHQLLGERR